jgi:hypothetical protein
VSGDHIGKVLEFLQELGAMLLQIRTRVTLETALREIDETLSDGVPDLGITHRFQEFTWPAIRRKVESIESLVIPC